MNQLFTYLVRWRTRDGKEESRRLTNIEAADRLKRFLIDKNVTEVDIAVSPASADGKQVKFRSAA